ncbi:ORF6N domain-containing protein [Fusobacterium polymorphum]|uniref:ORF6N domain-containing protein n=1 Tax=Fusobacterium nucleatum subsp. polymorphum TaxID=76857 RepID=UPI003007FB9C
MTNNLVKINEDEIVVKEYENQRIVTAWDIAKVHKREVKTINQSFKLVKDKMIENEDYFIIEKSEKLRSENLTLKNLWDNAPAAKEIILFTESGYLMLVKTFTDDLSWDIQRQLVKGYFKLKENNQKSLTLPQQLLAQAQYLVEIDNRVSVVEDKVDNEIRVDNGEQRKIQKAVGTRIYQRIDIVPQLAENKKFVFQALYRDLKDRFGVASYRDIKRKDLTNCLEYISTWIEPADLRIGA